MPTKWTLAIEINRRALLRLLRSMLDMVGTGETVTRVVHRAVLAILLPAEAAARRLVAIAARGVEVGPRRKRTCSRGSGGGTSGKKGAVFPLFDRRRYAGPPKQKKAPGRGPGVRGFDGIETDFYEPTVTAPDDPVIADSMRRRLEALGDALDNIPAQARRLARMLAAQDRPIRPMRPGRPPGHREKGRRPVDVILADCHELALMAHAEPAVADTS